MWHQSTRDSAPTLCSRLTVDAVSPSALMTTQLFHVWPDSPHDNDHVGFGFILTSSIAIMLTNLCFRTVKAFFYRSRNVILSHVYQKTLIKAYLPPLYWYLNTMFMLKFILEQMVLY